MMSMKMMMFMMMMMMMMMMGMSKLGCNLGCIMMVGVNDVYDRGGG